MIRRISTQLGFWLFFFGFVKIFEGLLGFFSYSVTQDYWTWLWRGILTIEMVVGLVILWRHQIFKGESFWKASLPPGFFSIGAGLVLGTINLLGAQAIDLLRKADREGVFSFDMIPIWSLAIYVGMLIVGIIMIVRASRKNAISKTISE